MATSVAEYGLLLALIAVVSIAAITAFGAKITTTFTIVAGVI